MDLTDRVVLVTGGTRMGASLGAALGARGARVAFSCARSTDAIAHAVDRTIAAGGQAVAIGADLRDPAACEQLVTEAIAWGGRLDVLVALASTYERVPIAEVTDDAWRAHLAVDLDATFHCARAAALHMRRRGGGGHLLFCSDWVAASGRPRYTGYVPYYVAKAGVVALTEALALELAGDAIQVNAIAPGPILPAVGSSPEMQASVIRATPLGHWGGPAALTHAVMGLLDQDWVTGQTLRVDGGRHLH
ncbi:pteridine reductase [Luteitalea sp. TBR-22]|uniref:SDR family NAD(P)-dependent oxidoreductase n=1 Tax=Luteitalea sp. TBR-22 TaxID=2802971 RepID=UPI001AF713FB|nr:SDR family oxidoreductase [Luteitalea sp. TBR-22]BCS36035.1 pteridine reductase [Luteitalea sp. TBR-22]